jgi:two-component system phosphate regulon sensor histidine kinase PhoR
MANPAARGMFSMTAVPEGKHFLEVTQHIQLESVIREAAKSQGVIEREMTIVRGLEDITLQVFAVCVFSEGHAYGVILLVQDITRLRRLETLRSDFAANVSHELKTPLTVIRGFTDTLKDITISREDADRFIDIISIESERLSRLIDDILLLSDIENSSYIPAAVTDMRDGVSEALTLLESKAKSKQIELCVSMDKKAVTASAEKDRIKQMAINLIDNAIKYTPSGGKVSVSVIREDGFGLLRVEDTGIGIPQGNIPRLFERFYRVDKSRSRALGGTGLGLAIVKHIVKLFGGHITVISEVGKGSVFTVSLPLDKDLELG